MKKLLFAALLLASPLSAQVQDTARATAELAISFEPGSIVTRGDTTLVYVGVTHDSDSLQAAVDRASLALQAAILADGSGRESSGTPGWFYGGVLALGAAAILTWAFKDTETSVVVTQEQSQGGDGEAGTTGTTTTTTTTTERFPWCWPPGHCKRKRGGGDDD